MVAGKRENSRRARTATAAPQFTTPVADETVDETPGTATPTPAPTPETVATEKPAAKSKPVPVADAGTPLDALDNRPKKRRKKVHGRTRSTSLRLPVDLEAALDYHINYMRVNHDVRLYRADYLIGAAVAYLRKLNKAAENGNHSQELRLLREMGVEIGESD